MPAQKINSQSSIEEPTKNECTESPEEEFRRTTSPRTKARADKTVTAEKINVTSKDSGKKDAEFSKQDPEPAKYCTAVKACAISEELESDSEGSIDVSAYPLVEKGLHDYKYYADQLGFDEAYLVHNDESGFEFTNDAGDSVIVIGMDDEEETYIVQVLFDSYNKEQKGRLYEAPIADFKQKYPYRGGSKLARKSNIPRSSSKAKQSKRKTSAVAEESIANPEEGANVCRAKRERDSSGSEDDESSTIRHRHKSVKTNQFLETKKEITWTTRMAMLTAHKEKYNTCDLTHAPTGSIDPLLQNFVCESRKQYKRFQRGDHSTLTMEKIERMRGLGFVFSPMESGSTRENRDRRLQKRWDARFKELERYKAEYGDCLVKTIGGDHPKLGNWVRGQRKLVNKLGREGISPDRLAKLDAIGFDYNPVTSGAHFSKRRANMMPRIEANWEKHYKQLVLYKKKHGDLIVGPNSVGYPGLFEWIHHQRKEYKKWELCNEKALMFDSWIAKLNGLGFDWAPMKSGAFREFVLKRKSEKNSDLWHRRYRELQKFHKKNGHCYVSYRDDDEVLARWINVQRKLKRKHDQGEETPLTEERMKLLKGINLDWNPSLSGGMTKITQAKHDKEWEDAFQKLCAFKKKRGHANPKKTVAKLGPWAYRMRKLYADKVSGKATTLSDTKVAKLESVGFNFVSGA